MFKFEEELVNSFISSKSVDANLIKECSFRWGNIDLVEYRIESINYLNSEQRVALSDKVNLKIFHVLFRKRPHTIKYISKNINESESLVQKRIKDLAKLNILERHNNCYLVNESIDFPDIKIFSYEMKLTDIKKAINQAVVNKKYSDYSYVVMPLDKYELCMKYKSMLQSCSIGLILVGEGYVKEVIRPKRILKESFVRLNSKMVLLNHIIDSDRVSSEI